MKNSRKNVAFAFYRALYDKNWAKIREIPLFSQKCEYLKITQTTKAFYPKVLEMWNLAKLWTNRGQKDCGIHFFHFLNFWPDLLVFCQKIGKKRVFFSETRQNTAKNSKNPKSELVDLTCKKHPGPLPTALKISNFNMYHISPAQS